MPRLPGANGGGAGADRTLEPVAGVGRPARASHPPLRELRRPSLAWRLRRPLAWAATVVLALGLGWYARGFGIGPVASGEHTDAIYPSPAVIGSPVTASGSRSPDSAPSARAAQRELATANQPADEALDRRKSLDATPLEPATGQVPASPPPAVRGAVAAPEPPVANQGVPARDAEARVAWEWPLIGRQPARDLLGVDPVAIPGFTIRAYRRNPAAGNAELVVEQVIDGRTVSLTERRLDVGRADGTSGDVRGFAAKAANERLARFVGLLRVEIDGPFTPDSLSRLLDLVR